MAQTSEQTFSDRSGRATTMNETVNGFSPPFAPGDVSLQYANFKAYNGTCLDKNEQVGDFKQTYTTMAGQRFTHTKNIKDITRRCKNYIESKKSLKPYLKTANALSLKITNSPNKKPKAPSGSETGSETKKRNSGEQSYADISSNFKVFINFLNGIGGGYDTPTSELQTANLLPLQTGLVTFNEDLGELAGNVKVSGGQRKVLYDNEDGLKDKMKSIKRGVKSQYGPTSPEYNSIRLIKP